VVASDDVLGMRTHVAIAAEMGRPDGALLAVSTQLPLGVALACHDEAHWKAMQALLAITELAELQASFVGFG
jgi:hypothetical protein